MVVKGIEDKFIKLDIAHGTKEMAKVNDVNLQIKQYEKELNQADMNDVFNIVKESDIITIMSLNESYNNKTAQLETEKTKVTPDATLVASLETTIDTLKVRLQDYEMETSNLFTDFKKLTLKQIQVSNKYYF